MAYVSPGVEVYEEIVNSGGTNATIPALPTVIVGPAYNILQYTVGDPSANVDLLAETLSGSQLDVATQLTYPGAFPGQVVTTDSVEVWVSDATVQTFAASATVSSASGNVLTQLSGQQAFTITQGGVAAVQTGYAATITYADGTVQKTTVYTPITATALTLADTLSGSGTVSVSITNVFDDVQLASTEFTAEDAYVTLSALPTVSYGSILSGNFYISYNALRQDIVNQTLTFNDIGDVTGTLGLIQEPNRLAIGLQCALAGSGSSPVYGVAVSADDLDGYLGAVEALENQFVYCIVPLTQQIDVLTAIQANVNNMSLPANRGFRVMCCNTQMATSMDIGIYGLQNPNSGTISNNTGGTGYVLTASNATFISDGVDPGDLVNLVSGGVVSSTLTVQNVVSNQQLVVAGSTVSTGSYDYYVTRVLSTQQMAQNVADVSSTFNDSRVWHVQPDIVGVPIGTQTVYLPGYYLAAAYGGMSAGEPSQQSFTNGTVPGISDLQHSNFFFTKSQLDLMAGAGTCLTVQKNQGGVPYCRHSLTTNVATITNQEIMITRDVDAVAYYFLQLLTPFIGQWNVVSETIHIIQQTVQAGINTLIAAKLPQIGAPLRSGSSLQSVVQNPNAADSINVTINAEVPYPNNYTYIYLEV